MKTTFDRSQENKNHTLANQAIQQHNVGGSTFQFADKRSEATAQRQLIKMANDGTQENQSQLIQRMSVNNTNWASATSVHVSAGGGTGGVLIFNDGSEPVVVKPGQQLAAEILIAATLGNKVLGESQEDQWTIGTPLARASTDLEAQVIKNRATALLGPTAAEERNLAALNKLDDPTTVVFKHASGEDFGQLLANSKHTKKKKTGSGRTLRPESAVAEMWKSPGPLTLLGQASAVDIFMGNGDRLVMLVNPDNWKVDQGQKAINLIDNVHESMQGVFELDENDNTPFQTWITRSWVLSFIKGDLAEIASDTVDRLIIDLNANLRASDQPLLSQQLQANSQQMKQWFGTGLFQGKQKLIAVLNNPNLLVNGVPNEKRKNALRSIHARKLALQGTDIDTAIYIAQQLLP
jgi:hypothetical protein